MRTLRNGDFQVRGLQSGDLAGLADLVPESWLPERIQGLEEPVPSLDGWSWGDSSRVADLQLDVADEAS